MRYYGIAEVPGVGSNRMILKMIREMFPNHDDDSTIAWCSIFMHYIAREAGYYVTRGSDAGMARSWLNVGIPVDLSEAVPGDIAVFWRGSKEGSLGHVGLFINLRDPDTLRILGGNQDNAVNIRFYQRARLLGLRRIAMPGEVDLTPPVM